ncbi:hypothetical protein [Paenibacillus methanolicus]|uniref:hypothetical protein n=1 Tax=Paenibacillus methanolicus TaxID=582686 RepID=UPI0011E670D2|nr:hypothetical protein [Paenibacillus methanolicus]
MEDLRHRLKKESRHIYFGIFIFFSVTINARAETVATGPQTARVVVDNNKCTVAFLNPLPTLWKWVLLL